MHFLVNERAVIGVARQSGITTWLNEMNPRLELYRSAEGLNRAPPQRFMRVHLLSSIIFSNTTSLSKFITLLTNSFSQYVLLTTQFSYISKHDTDSYLR